MNQEEQQAEQQKQAEQQIKLLKQLDRFEEFHTFRDFLIKPELEQLEYNLKSQADNMSESVLRADLKHYFKLKDLFYKVFEQIKTEDNG